MSNLSNPKRIFSTFKWPSKHQWGKFFKVLSKKEKIIFSVALASALSSFLAISFGLYFKNTQELPASGGSYIEGVVGSPRFINPIYAASFDVDRDLTELIYSGLMKYDESGTIVPDLAKEYKISENGKIYEFYLKENLLWQDGQPLTIDDVIFTIKAIQNPSLKSPLRPNWLGVKVEKISELGISFELKDSSAVFFENTTLKILPRHVWEDISAQNFPLSIYNLKPIGSGPYKFKNLVQNNQGSIKSLELVANPNYWGTLPNISKIIFRFFENEDQALKALKAGEINGLALLSINKYQRQENKGFNDYHLSLPRYFAVFLNSNSSAGGSKILADKNVRLALNYGTDKKEIINKILSGSGIVVDSPILPEIYGFEPPEKTYQFDIQQAKQLLEEAGFVERENGLRSKTLKKEPAFQFKSNLQAGSSGNEVKEVQKCLVKEGFFSEDRITGYFGDETKTAVIKFQEKYREEILNPQGLAEGTGEVKKATRDKLNELCAASAAELLPLTFELITVNQPIITEVASLLKEQWRLLGVDLTIKTLDIAALEEQIKLRNYQMLLFGEILGTVPDPFPFWHSSQKKDPGLNLVEYGNKKADKLLEQARQTLDEQERKTALENFQDILIQDAPAVFLYNPDYLYLISKKVKGIGIKTIADPCKRFVGIENWYIKTKRVWK